MAERREKDNVRARNLFVSDEWARDKVYDETMRHSKKKEKEQDKFGRSRCQLDNNGHASGLRVRLRVS